MLFAFVLELTALGIVFAEAAFQLPKTLSVMAALPLGEAEGLDLRTAASVLELVAAPLRLLVVAAFVEICARVLRGLRAGGAEQGVSA